MNRVRQNNYDRQMATITGGQIHCVSLKPAVVVGGFAL